MSDIPDWIDKDPQHCAWCPEPARGDAWHNDYKLHPSCGQIGHGEGWVPELEGKTETARPLPDREEIIHLLKREFWPFLAHNPANPARFWGQSADAVLALLKGKNT